MSALLSGLLTCVAVCTNEGSRSDAAAPNQLRDRPARGCLCEFSGEHDQPGEEGLQKTEQ